MINSTVLRVKLTRRNNVVLSILARGKSFWELVKTIYLPSHFPRDSESIVSAKSLSRVCEI